jgi:ketosteroid isomerase-like protein
MSTEEVEVRNEVVRRFFWAFENDTDAFRDTLHPDIEWYPIEEDRTPSYGVEAAVRNRKPPACRSRRCRRRMWTGTSPLQRCRLCPSLPSGIVG